MSGSARRQGLYEDPVLYDILQTPGTADEVTVLERIEREFGPQPLAPDRLWFEPACGTGRYLRVAAGRGRRVAGFDCSPAMIAYAQRRLAARAGRADLFTADLTDFLTAARSKGLKRGRGDFALQPVNTLRHLAGDDEVLAHLAQMAALLAPGGLYVVGISLTDYENLLPEEDLWEGARGSCRVSQLVNYLPPEPRTPLARTERVVSHLTVTRPGGVEHLDDVYELRCYSPGQWRKLVSRSPLQHAASLDGWGAPLAGLPAPYQLEVLVNPG